MVPVLEIRPVITLINRLQTKLTYQVFSGHWKSPHLHPAGHRVYQHLLALKDPVASRSGEGH